MWKLALILALATTNAEAQVVVDTSTEAYQDNLAQSIEIVAHIQQYVTLMSLEGWRIYLRMELENPRNEGVTASTSAHPEYRTAQMIFYLTAFRRASNSQQHEIYRHELFHLLLWPIGEVVSNRYCCQGEMFALMMRLREGVATNLARMKVWNRYERN